jgi:hypothetical protein
VKRKALDVASLRIDFANTPALEVVSLRRLPDSATADLYHQLQGGVFEWPQVLILLWPTVFFAAALNAATANLVIVIIFTTISVVLNMLVYAWLGAVLYWLFGHKRE